MKLNHIHKALIIWLASFLLAGLSSELKKPSITILSFLVGTGATAYITNSKPNWKSLTEGVIQTETQEVNPPAKQPAEAPQPINKPIKKIDQHTPQPSTENWERVCAEAKNPESGAAFLKGLLEPLSLWGPIKIGKGEGIDILAVEGGNIFHKGTEMPTDIQIHIALDQPIEWKEAAQWVKGNRYLGFKTSLDSKGYLYSPYIKVSLPKEGKNEVVTLSISIEGVFTQ